jgi:hypothetical protein
MKAMSGKKYTAKELAAQFEIAVKTIHAGRVYVYIRIYLTNTGTAPVGQTGIKDIDSRSQCYPATSYM